MTFQTDNSEAQDPVNNLYLTLYAPIRSHAYADLGFSASLEGLEKESVRWDEKSKQWAKLFGYWVSAFDEFIEDEGDKSYVVNQITEQLSEWFEEKGESPDLSFTEELRRFYSATLERDMDAFETSLVVLMKAPQLVGVYEDVVREAEGFAK